MDKRILGLLLSLALVPSAQGRHDGGAVAAGALGGLAIGTMLGQATASSDRSGRVEEKLEQEKRARDQEKVRELEQKLEQKDLERKIEQQRIAQENAGDYRHMITLIILGIMAAILLALFGVGLAVLFHRKKGGL